MGTSGGGWDDVEEHYFGQEDRLYMEAREAEYSKAWRANKWKIRAYLAAIVLIPLALAVWLGLSVL